MNKLTISKTTEKPHMAGKKPHYQREGGMKANECVKCGTLAASRVTVCPSCGTPMKEETPDRILGRTGPIVHRRQFHQGGL
ncbi:zinc ribbon domain-containing protein [Paraburkholderia sp. RL17-337-BIB-A]|uniref:zinc ribbon domain-containing protein n=1 Tax=Paraburkholderia sp. RL17-337-BIB-A TaxID=3031636 RepID=UPI0038BA1A75